MSLLMIIIIGAIIGWAGARITGRHEGIIASIIIGIVGAFIGTTLAKLLGSGSESYLSLTWSGAIWSLIGAVILAALLNTFQGRHSHHHV